MEGSRVEFAEMRAEQLKERVDKFRIEELEGRNTEEAGRITLNLVSGTLLASEEASDRLNRWTRKG